MNERSSVVLKDSVSLLCGQEPASIEIEAVSWSPTPRHEVLQPVCVTIKAGEFVAIVGPNGSGKTSLLRCLYRVNKPTSGQVLLDGLNIWQLTPLQCAKRIATVLQDSSADFGLTVFDMVDVGLTPNAQKWGRSEEDAELIEQALSLLDVLHLADREFSSLSGGERQRVMIARALAQQPDVLILDEPTNHLDIRHQLDVLALLATLPCTVIVSLHDLALASAYADNVMVMHDGKLEVYAPPSEAFTPERIKQVFDVDTVIDAHPMTQKTRFSFYISDEK